MKYKIAMHHTDEGISVSVPALPGCWSCSFRRLRLAPAWRRAGAKRKLEIISTPS